MDTKSMNHDINSAGEKGFRLPEAISFTPVDVSRYFTGFAVESEYLEKLLAGTIRQIRHSGEQNDLRFGSVIEGHTIAGGIAEVTGDHCIRIDSHQLKRYEESVAMALVAHELAHDHLRHFKTWKNNLDQEHAADNLARTWGFNIDRFRKVCGPPCLNRRLQRIAVIN